MKYIFHLDLDAFFASVEEAKNPKLKSKPVVISSHSMNSVISTANYVARKKGIKSAMPIFKAKQLCPELIIVPLDFHSYEEYSIKFINILKEKFTNQIEICSIDECYMDVNKILSKYKNDPIFLAKKIQQKISTALNITVSVGIGYNKFTAKMATDINKPNGVTVINDENYKQILWPMDIGQMFFVGKKTAEKLKEININTIGDLAQYSDLDKLKSVLNKNWLEYHQHANGLGNDQLDYSKNVPKSLSVSRTFLSPTSNEIEIINEIKTLTIELFEKLKYHNLSAKTYGIHYKDINRNSFTKNMTLSKYICTYEDLLDNLIKLFEDIYSNQTWRLIGVNVSNLIQLETNEDNIFSFIKNDKKNENKIDDIIKIINEKFEQNLVFIAKKKLQ